MCFLYLLFICFLTIMEFTDNSFHLQTNLSKSCFDKLQSGVWKIGRIDDNPGIEEKSNETFYKTKEVAGQSVRCFKHKVPVVLYDGSTVEAHIIHWHRLGRWFCVTFDRFWDNL